MEESHILVLDDSKDFIFLLSSLLKFHKIKVDGAAKASDALKLSQSNSYSLIITDYLMDEFNGLEFAAKIRSDGLNKETPMILITAKNLEMDELTTLNKLSMTYVKKPVLPNELYRKINDILGRKT
jgi:DNA-binding response OmpR family regulator